MAQLGRPDERTQPDRPGAGDSRTLQAPAAQTMGQRLGLDINGGPHYMDS